MDNRLIPVPPPHHLSNGMQEDRGKPRYCSDWRSAVRLGKEANPFPIKAELWMASELRAKFLIPHCQRKASSEVRGARNRQTDTGRRGREPRIERTPVRTGKMTRNFGRRVGSLGASPREPQ